VFKFIDTSKPCVDINTLMLLQVKRLKLKLTTLVHVGAYDGVIATSFVKQLKPLATRTLAFEPCVRSFKALKSNASKLESVECFHNAIGAVARTSNLFVETREKPSQSNSTVSEFLDGKDQELIRSESVKIITMQDVLINHDLKTIDLLRINCEGGEFEIFNGDTEFLKYTNILALAIHGKESVFSTDEMIQNKIEITEKIKSYKMKLIYGFEFSRNSLKVPVGHVWQVWIKK